MVKSVQETVQKKRGISYKDAGVSIDEADRAVASIRSLARKTFTSGVLTDIGSFGGGFLLKGLPRAGAGFLGGRRGH